MYSHRILPQNTGQSPDFRVGATFPSIAGISTEITINGVTKSATLAYRGSDATASEWVGVAGPTLGVSTAGTAAPVAGHYTPLSGTAPRLAGMAAAGKCYAAAAGAVG